jgi:hypothetical protein
VIAGKPITVGKKANSWKPNSIKNNPRRQATVWALSASRKTSTSMEDRTGKTTLTSVLLAKIGYKNLVKTMLTLILTNYEYCISHPSWCVM